MESKRIGSFGTVSPGVGKNYNANTQTVSYIEADKDGNSIYPYTVENDSWSADGKKISFPKIEVGTK